MLAKLLVGFDRIVTEFKFYLYRMFIVCNRRFC